MPERDPLRSQGDFVIDVEAGDGGPWAYKSFRTQTPFTITGSGDFVVRTGDTERARIKADGTMTGFAGTNSPAFTGVPTAPTALPSTDNNQIATTAFAVPRGTTRTDLGPSVYFDLELSGSGTGSAGTPFDDYQPGSSFFNFRIASDAIFQNSSSASYVNGINLEHHYGGAAAAGGRSTLNVLSFYDGGTMAGGGTNPANGSYAAIQANCTAMNSDGGTAGNYHGGIFGSSAIVSLESGANYYNSITGGEFDILTATGTHPNYVAGIMVVGGLAANGDTWDTGYALSGLGGGRSVVGFKTAFLIGDMNGAAALSTTSTVLRVVNHATLANGLDFSGTTFTGYVLKTGNGFEIDAPAGNHALHIGRQDGVSSFPEIDFHTSTTPTTYDIRLLGTPGNGTTGSGGLNVYATELQINGSTTAAVPLAVNAASGQTSDIANFQVNGTQKASITAAGQFKTIAGNEATGASTPAFGSNFPGTVTTAPYKWLKFTASDGTQVYVPAWK